MARPPSRYRRPTRRGALMAVAIIVVASAIVGWSSIRRDGDDEPPEETLDRVGSEQVDGNGVEITDEPASYRITYDFRLRGTAPEVEELTVVRPFWAEMVTRAEDGDVVSRQRWSFGRVHTSEGPILAAGPSTPANDLRFAPALADAVRDGLLRRREVREVAGRRCQVYRAASSMDSGAPERVANDASDYADICVDEHGLMLEEWWVVEGAAIRQRVATDVTDAPTEFADEWASADQSIGAKEGGGSILRLRDGSAPPGEFFSVPAAPTGFSSLGRFSVVSANPGALDESDLGPIATSTADVWRRGIDVVILEQGGRYNAEPVYAQDPDNRTVDIPGVGTAEIVVSFNGNEIRVHRTRGRFVRMLGTVPIDDLLAFARTLVLGTGNELVVDQDAELPSA